MALIWGLFGLGIEELPDPPHPLIFNAGKEVVRAAVLRLSQATQGFNRRRAPLRTAKPDREKDASRFITSRLITPRPSWRRPTYSGNRRGIATSRFAICASQ